MKWGGIMVVFSIISFAAGVINSFYAAHVSQNFGFDVRKAIFEKADQHAAVNTFPGLVHTARHTMGAGNTRSQ